MHDALICRLRVRAAEQGISAEELHRRILRDALVVQADRSRPDRSCAKRVGWGLV
jgi:plasmid stability protein